MKKKVFIDGGAGTTGLRIADRLKAREDITLLTLGEQDRKVPACRKNALNSADIVFLCLPDAAAVEAVSLVENPATVVIDASTAHRTENGWSYGFPELSEAFETAVKNSKRIAVPGCHASGFAALVYPLVEKGLLAPDTLLSCHSLTGYSGGGKKMIAEYEAPDKSVPLRSPRQYGIAQNHKHLKEMKAITGLVNAPIFCPIVADFYSGMQVTVPLFASQLNEGFSVEDIKAVYKNKYKKGLVTCLDRVDEEGFVASNALSGKDTMQITVAGNEDRILLIARYDNLGKGASGAAVECMNLCMGVEKTTGLDI